MKISKTGVQKSLHGWIYKREVSGAFSLLHSGVEIKFLVLCSRLRYGQNESHFLL